MKLDDIVRKKPKGVKRELQHLKKQNRPSSSESKDPISDGPGEEEPTSGEEYAIDLNT